MTATMPESPTPADDETARQIRGSSLLLSGRVLSMFVNLFVQVLIVRYLTKSDFGAFAYALAFTTTAKIIVTLGHNRIISRFLSIYEERRDYGKLLGTLAMEVGIIVTAGIALFVAVFMMQGWLVGDVVSDPTAVHVLLILLLLAPVEAIEDLVEGMFAVFARPKMVFVRRYLVAPALRLAVVALLIATDSGVLFLAAGYVVATVLGVTLYIGALRRLMQRRGVLGQRYQRLSMPFREVFGFSFPLLSTELVVISMNTVAVVLLGRMEGTDAVAELRAIRPAALLNQFVMRSFTLLFLPLAARLYARGDQAAMRDAYWQTAVWLTVITFPVFALTAPFARPTTLALFGEQYAASALYLAVLSAGYYFNVCLGFNALILQVHGRLRYLVVVNVFCAVLNVVACLALIPPLGALGVAVAGGGTLAVQNVLNQAGLRRMGIGAFSIEHSATYLSVLAAASLLTVVALTVDLSIYGAVPIAAAVSLAVLLANRSALRIGDTFPRLSTVRALRWLLGLAPPAADVPSTRPPSQKVGP